MTFGWRSLTWAELLLAEVKANDNHGAGGRFAAGGTGRRAQARAAGGHDSGQAEELFAGKPTGTGTGKRALERYKKKAEEEARRKEQEGETGAGTPPPPAPPRVHGEVDRSTQIQGGNQIQRLRAMKALEIIDAPTHVPLILHDTVGNKFTVDNVNMTSAAHYSSSENAVHLFKDSSGNNHSQEDTIGILAHEYSHAKFDEVENFTHRGVVMKDSGENLMAHQVAEVGQVRELMKDYRQGSLHARLKVEDGVSSYTSKYWSEASSHPDSSSLDQLARNETLADISRIKAGNHWSGDNKTISPTWLGYHDNLQKAYTIVRNWKSS